MVNLNGPQLRYVLRVSVGIFVMDPSLVMLGGGLVGNSKSDVLGPSVGRLVGRSLKAWRLVHPMGPGWGDL